MDWLVDAFGFEVRLKFLGPVDAIGWKTPEQVGAATQAVYVRVDDLAAHCERARQRGAVIETEPAHAHGQNRYRARDPEGHRWTFAEPD